MGWQICGAVVPAVPYGFTGGQRARYCQKRNTTAHVLHQSSRYEWRDGDKQAQPRRKPEVGRHG